MGIRKGRWAGASLADAVRFLRRYLGTQGRDVTVDRIAALQPDRDGVRRVSH